MSEYFDNMFSGHFMESATNGIDDPIIVNDIDEVAFKAILKFLYTDKIEIDSSNFLALLRTRNFLKLRVPSFDMKCLEYIKNCAEKKNNQSEMR